MARIFVFNLGLHGHINPTLGVIHELVQGGDEVVYFAPPEFGDTILQTGARFRPYQSLFHRDKSPSEVPMPVRLIRDCAQVLPQIASQILEDKPDAIIYDMMCLPGRLLAEMTDLPSIKLYCSYAANAHFSLPEPWDSPATHVLFDEAVNPLVERYGIKPFGLETIFKHEAPLNIVFLPREFQPRPETFGPNYIFVGPALVPFEDSREFPDDFLDRHPLMYFSLGTVFNHHADYFRICIDAFRDTSWNVIMSLGDRHSVEKFGDVPKNFLIKSFVPQIKVLKSADLFVTHGGMNSVQGALYHGVPMVVIPQMHEQVMSAKRVVELGAGLQIETNNLSVNSLRSAADMISKAKSFKESAIAMGKKGREAGGSKKAAREIRNYLGR
jgi:MGT family glycosyltransferase